MSMVPRRAICVEVSLFRPEFMGSWVDSIALGNVLLRQMFDQVNQMGIRA
jgi:hypothetical protein